MRKLLILSEKLDSELLCMNTTYDDIKKTIVIANQKIFKLLFKIFNSYFLYN